jgi:hypothetical protein
VEYNELERTTVVEPFIKGSSFPDWIEHITHKFPYGADYIITLN